LSAEKLPDNQQVIHIIHAVTDSTLGVQLPLSALSTGCWCVRNVLDYAVRNDCVLNIAKAKQYQGLKVRVSLEDAILKTANKIKARHEKQYPI
jgi:nucleoside-diphosphate-sugar epimerase